MRGREYTEYVMTVGSGYSALILAIGLLAYLFLRKRGYKINIILFYIIFLFPTSVLYFDVGFHLFYHRILLILYFTYFFLTRIFSFEKMKIFFSSTAFTGLYFLVMCLPGLLVSLDYGNFWRWWVAFLVGIFLYIIIVDHIKDKGNLKH